MKIEIADIAREIDANWEQAKLYCFSLGEGWRLPTQKELDDMVWRANILDHVTYWSSTLDDKYQTDACATYGGSGSYTYIDKLTILRVRPVRDLTYQYL